jgi:hypothetical protein
MVRSSRAVYLRSLSPVVAIMTLFDETVENMPHLHVRTTVMLLQDQHTPLHRVCLHGAKLSNCIFEFELPIITRFFLDVFWNMTQEQQLAH